MGKGQDGELSCANDSPKMGKRSDFISAGSNSGYSSGSELLMRRISFDTRSFMLERVDSEISQRYDIDAREIGVGGYGKVYLAKDRMFRDRRVAIKKVIKLDKENHAFRKEVNIMKELDHPCVCRLFETYDQECVMYFVIEYFEGGDLYDCLIDKGKIQEAIMAPIIKQVACALKYAHGKGIAHRDL